MRRSPIVSSLLAAGLLVGLAACTPQADETAPDDTAQPTATECATSGPSSEAVSVSGDFGSAPTIDVTGTLAPDTTEVTILSEGEGEEVAEGDVVDLSYAILNGDSGEEIESTFTGEQTVQLLVDSASPVLAGLSKAVACATEGSRVVGVIPPIDAFGEAGAPDFGLEADQPLVFVADILRILPEPLARAEGDAQEAPAGLPTVELDENGAPTITIPDTAPPAEYQEAVLIQGDGEEVSETATVTVHYTGINWNTGEIFDSSWERGQPAQFPTGGVIPGFRDALVGSTVGSQIIAVIPPELGYGPQGGTPDGGIGPDDTIVFVVDILATAG
ncbi:MAG TPA: FKBP-type peptidyl-prolyl cis-trans isomerase [Microcella sp.]|nr:FKBP-type peptidyl-prolyl cis-trans isomerase [Microcella sp.]